VSVHSGIVRQRVDPKPGNFTPTFAHRRPKWPKRAVVASIKVKEDAASSDAFLVGASNAHPARATAVRPQTIPESAATTGGRATPDPAGLVIDTIAPLHHTTGMRLTINLEPELYAVAVSLAKAEDCSISAAVNRLVRRALPGAEPHRAGIAARMERRNGLLVSRGSEVITPEMVQRVEAEDDAR